ncbi:MAG TPA: dTMP kinase [Lentisphaeria bacterium]|nr:MAG: dTMP kinase [Lentisphaerae bacterium GWF2_49_21]HBC85487.1 dTMP kinase [Lentisphaeria bacterium]
MKNKSTRRGIFITFEGAECAGKSTHIRLLEKYFQKKKIKYVLTREPGGTEIGEEIRTIVKHHAGKNPVSDEAELLLFAASRAQHVREVIIPALQKGTSVICDRFTDSTVAYQGHARGLDLKFIGVLNKFASIGRTPDLTVILDLPPEESRARIMERNKLDKVHDRIENERVAFHIKVRNAFLKIARAEPKRVKMISSDRPIEAVHNDIVKAVENAIASFPK